VLSNGFKQGFKLGYKGSHLGSSANNLVSTKVHFSEVQKKIDKEISLGRISGPFKVPPISNLKVSPLGILEKPDGGWRLITHLSYPNGSSVNDGFSVEDISVKYTSFDKVADMLFSLGTSAMMAKRDIKSAFRLMPIYPGDFHLMGLQFNNQYYVDKCLPMGLSIAPALFESFSTFIHWLVSFKTGIQTLDHYLDDFIFGSAAGSNNCNMLVSTFEEVCTEMGVPVAVEKSVGPTTVLTFLGLELDTVQMTVRVPAKKVEELLKLLQNCLVKKRLTLKELQSLTGKLSFCSQAVRASRAFLRRFYDAMCGLKKSYYKIRVNGEMREDILMWIQFIEDFNGVVHIPNKVWLDNSVIHLYTDSAGGATLGCGCYFGGNWAYCPWPVQWQGQPILSDITFLEMVPVLLAIWLWGVFLRDRKIKFHIDNLGLVEVINKQSSKSKRLMFLVRTFVLLVMKYSVVFKAVHISSKSNYIADAISRKQFHRLQQLAPEAQASPESVPPEFLLMICNKRLIDC